MSKQAKEKTENVIRTNKLAGIISRGEVSGLELESVWSELYQLTVLEMRFALEKQVRINCGSYLIEREAFVEAFDTAIIEAVNGYDEQRGDYLARVHHIASWRCKNIVTAYRAHKRVALTEALSLDVQIQDGSDGDATHLDQLMDPRADVEYNAISAETGVMAMLNRYGTLSDVKHKEMQLVLIYMEYDNERERKGALMGYFDNKVSWTNVRKQVSRAKANFKKYLIDEGVIYE